MFLFYRNLKLCPRENFIEMLTWRSYTLGPKNFRFGAFIKKVSGVKCSYFIEILNFVPGKIS